MTSVLDTEVAVVANPAIEIWVSIAITQVCDEQEIVEVKPVKKQKIQITATQIPSIDLSDYDTEEEVITPMAVLEEVDEYLQAFMDFFNGNGMKGSIPILKIS